MTTIMIGLDIAKSVFQVQVADATGKLVVQKKLRRGQVLAWFKAQRPAQVGMEACGSAHYWARQLQALGHTVRLIPAQYVKPFVRRNKNDARDAEAICEAMSRPNMRFVAVKSIGQQVARGLERARDLLVKQHTQMMNCVRGLLAELGIVAAQGRRGFAELAGRIVGDDAEIPDATRKTLRPLLRLIAELERAIAEQERRIVEAARAHPVMRRLASIPGVGPMTAHAVVTAIGDGRQFGCARDFAAWCGLTPLEHSSAGKRREKGISRQGDIRLRKLFALGASTIMRNARTRRDSATVWQRGILARRPMKVAVLAQAAKTARIAWAILVSGESYRRPAQVPA